MLKMEKTSKNMHHKVSRLIAVAFMSATCFCVQYVAHGYVIDRYPAQQRQNKIMQMIDSERMTSENHNRNIQSVDEMGRRRFLHNFVTTSLGVAIVMSHPAAKPVYAFEQPRPGDTLWMTGKMPIIPGQKPKDKNDVSGTRKDPSFLRALSDCKNRCESMTGSNNGYAKEKDECLSECQDICCTTYQQCTFPIVPRI